MLLSKYTHIQNELFPITRIQDAAGGNFLIGMEMSKQIESIIEATVYPDCDPNVQGRYIYNWNAVEESLARNFLVGKHFLSCEQIRMMHFKGELVQDPEADLVRVVSINITQ